MKAAIPHEGITRAARTERQGKRPTINRGRSNAALCGMQAVDLSARFGPRRPGGDASAAEIVRGRFVSDMHLNEGFHDSRQIHRRFLHRIVSGIGDYFELRIWEPRKISVLHGFLRKSKIVFSDTY